MKTVDAELWAISICDGAMDMIHGFSREIKEVLVPDYQLSFNIENGSLNCFRSDLSRYSNSKGNYRIKDFRISDEYAKKLNNMLDSKTKLHEQAKEIFKDEIK